MLFNVLSLIACVSIKKYITTKKVFEDKDISKLFTINILGVIFLAISIFFNFGLLAPLSSYSFISAGIIIIIIIIMTAVALYWHIILFKSIDAIKTELQNCSIVYCNKCGIANSAGTQFCTKCGANLSSEKEI